MHVAPLYGRFAQKLAQFGQAKLFGSLIGRRFGAARLFAHLSQKEVGVEILRRLHHFRRNLAQRRRLHRTKLYQLLAMNRVHLPVQPVFRPQFAADLDAATGQRFFEKPNEQGPGIVQGHVVGKP